MGPAAVAGDGDPPGEAAAVIFWLRNEGAGVPPGRDRVRARARARARGVRVRCFVVTGGHTWVLYGSVAKGGGRGVRLRLRKEELGLGLGRGGGGSVLVATA